MRRTSLTLWICALSVVVTIGAGEARPDRHKKPKPAAEGTLQTGATPTTGGRWQGFNRNRSWQTSNGTSHQKRATVTPTGNGTYTRNGTFSNTGPRGRTGSGTFQGTGQVTHSGNTVTNDYSGTRTNANGQTVDVNRDSTVTKTSTGFDKTTTTSITSPDGKPITTVNSDTTHVKGEGNTTEATVTGPAGKTTTIDSSSSRTGPGTFEQQATVKDANGNVIGGDQATGAVQRQDGSVVRTIDGTTDNGTQFSGTRTTTPTGTGGVTSTGTGTVTGPGGATTTATGRSTTTLNGTGGVTTTGSGTVTGPAAGTTQVSGTATASPTTTASAGAERLRTSLGLSSQQMTQIQQILSSTSDPAERRARIRAILTPEQMARFRRFRSAQQ